MAKNTKKTKQQPRAQKPKQPAMRQMILRSPALDAGALAHRRLLVDPCGAPLASPVYSGTGSGYLTRTRSIVTPAADDKDYLVAFQPGWFNMTNGFSNVGQLTHFGKNVTGAVIDGSVNQLIPFITGTTVGQMRCVSACLKVHYTGSEQARQGVIHKGYTLQNPFSGVGTGRSVSGTMDTLSSITARMPDGVSEARWVPAQGDERFVGRTLDNTLSNTSAAGCLVVGVQNANQGAFYFELIANWEWVPDSGNNLVGSGLVSEPRAPPSGFTLNNVLTTLGSIAEFVSSGPAHTALAAGARMSASMLFPRARKYITA